MSGRDDRCAPVPLRTLYRVPAATMKLYVLAAAEGRSMNTSSLNPSDTRSKFDALVKGERPIGVRISEMHRDRVLLEAGVGLRQWQAASRQWQELDLAHKCRRGRLFLLVRPTASDLCPDCERPLRFVSTRSENDLSQEITHSQRPSRDVNREPSIKGTRRGEGLDPEVVEQLKEKFGSTGALENPRRAVENEREVAG